MKVIKKFSCLLKSIAELTYSSDNEDEDDEINNKTWSKKPSFARKFEIDEDFEQYRESRTQIQTILETTRIEKG